MSNLDPLGIHAAPDALRELIGEGLKETVRRVAEEHRRAGWPLVISRGGKVIRVSADEFDRLWAAAGNGLEESQGPASAEPANGAE